MPGANAGMTLRDYFAAQILNGLIPQTLKEPDQALDLVILAYDFADAMLIEREKEPKASS